MVNILLAVKGLSLRYRAAHGAAGPAVDRVSLQVAAGEVLGLMGESGCGKTSLALALLGLLPPSDAEITGSVTFRGEELLGLGERALQKIRGARIAMVAQQPSIALSPMIRVGAQAAEVARAHHGWSWKRCCMAAGEMLVRVGLPATERIFSAYPHQLSGGQLQRVALAQALVCKPALLIADEPTASLDAGSRSEFVTLLREMKSSLGISMLLISHTPEIQASLADRLMVMRAGVIVEEGSFDRLYSNPSRSYTKSLLRRNRLPDKKLSGESPRREVAEERLALSRGEF